MMFLALLIPLAKEILNLKLSLYVVKCFNQV